MYIINKEVSKCYEKFMSNLILLNKKHTYKEFVVNECMSDSDQTFHLINYKNNS